MGDTGCLVAMRLAKHADVVGISVKPGLLSGQELGRRLARPEGWVRDYWLPFGQMRGLDGVRIVQGTLTALDVDGRVVTVRMPDGVERHESYDVLVISTGVTNGFWRRPTVQDVAEVDGEVASAHRRIRDATSVIVVGGGAAAVSVAAQTADVFPTKSVDLYFPGDRLVTRHHAKVSDDLSVRLERLGVGLHPGHRALLPERFDELGAGPVRWSSGQAPTHGDVVIYAVGRTIPNTSWLPPELLDDDGFVLADPELRVPGAENVFAIGDVAATDPQRSSARNFAYRVLARNIRATLNGGRLGQFRAPRTRWGSIMGQLSNGLVLYSPKGRASTVPLVVSQKLLIQVIQRRIIYGGIRRRSR